MTRKQREEIGGRLRQLRLAHGFSQPEWAKAIGVGRSAWSQYELGERLPGPLVLVRMCLRFGVTLDWIYLGRVEMLSTHVMNLLENPPQHPVHKGHGPRKTKRTPPA